MKKFLLLTFLAVFATNLFAQEEEEVLDFMDSSYRINIGVKGGINYATMGSLSVIGASDTPLNVDLDPSGSVGFQGGIAANVHFGRRTPKSMGGTGLFGIQLEAMYSQRTIKTNVEDLKLKCFEVPLLAQYYPIPELSIEVGPTFVGALGTSPDELNLNNGEILIATGDIKAFDIMLTAGVGYKHKKGFTASARYNLGTSELAENFTGKVSTFTLSVGWMFSIVK